MKIRNFISPFVLILLTLTIIHSCAKEEETIVKKDPKITWNNPADITYGAALNALQLNATANISGTFVYKPAMGTILNLGANQSLNVDFEPTDAIHFNSASKTVTINVTPIKKDAILTWEKPASIDVNTALSALQLNAKADIPGTFVYEPALGTKLSQGMNRELHVTFTPTDNFNYNIASKTVYTLVKGAPSSPVSDIDGNIYNTVTIGTQVWMAENLKTTRFNDGTAIPEVTDAKEWSKLTTPAFAWYDNNADENKDTYGALYNWFAINSGKLSPIGWHIPSESEWAILEIFLSKNGYNYDGSTDFINIGNNKLAKSLSFEWSWNSSTEKGAPGNNDYPEYKNVSGFSAIAGGFRSTDGHFSSKNYTVIWSTIGWEASEQGHSRFISNAYRQLAVEDFINSPRIGYSVRCIKD